MKKLTLILAAMVLTASQAFGQCGKCGYEVKAENAYTNYNVRYASNPMDAKHYTTDRLRGEFAIEKVFAPGEMPNSFISTSIEVCPSLLPSAMFCFVLLAACIIWSTVRSPYFGRYRWQNTCVSW